MELCQRKRGQFVTMEYLDDNRVNVIYQMPLAEIIFDFFDKLKSSTRGYASLDYELDGTQPSELAKIDILLNGDKVDALSFISHKEFAEKRARSIVEKLKKIIPRQNFEIPIQAAIGAKIIARTNIKAYRNILLNGDKVDALSFISHNEFAEKRARSIVEKLKKIIPRQNFEIPIQAAIGAKIIARTLIMADRKDVTARIRHCSDPYWGSRPAGKIA